MVYIMAKCIRSCHELNNTKNICSKVTKKYESSISDISSSYFDSSISSDSEWDEIIKPYERKDMKILYHVVTDYIKNKYQCNDPI